MDQEATVCSGGVHFQCNDKGKAAELDDCGERNLSCFPDIGCAKCYPGTRTCSGQIPIVCKDDGGGYTKETACEGTADSQCDVQTGLCANLCAASEESSSYIGCDYWAVTATNMVAPDFGFAVVIANPQSVDANVTVEIGGSVVASVSVAGGGVETIPVDWVPELKEAKTASVLARGSAYHVASSVPVTVYQFSPLEFEIPENCVDPEDDGNPEDGVCYSFTNDASLLFPTHVLTGTYMPVSVAGQRILQSSFLDGETDPYEEDSFDASAFVAIVGADDNDAIVTVHAAANLLPSLDETVPATAVDGELTVSLASGDTLELLTAPGAEGLCPEAEHPYDEFEALCLGPDNTPTICNVRTSYCALPSEYDLTGSRIVATGRVAVLAGHRCAFVPEYRYACDHLEDEIPPLESWGKRYIVTATKALRGEPNLVRILASENGTTLTFTNLEMESAALDAGDVLTFEAKEDFLVTASRPVLVSQFLVGQDYNGPRSTSGRPVGDPAMAIAVPSEQYRNSYDFLSPDTYTDNYVGFVVDVRQDVLLDGEPVDDWKRIGDTDYKTAHVRVDPGAHRATSTGKFGTVVYGFASYTSYFYPGGLDFHPINPLL
ncbi:MAG: IgGFc-binding protein [Myxococcales bacterium]|nr:IgGFc-binding protein [Myxococcales bacterium]